MCFAIIFCLYTASYLSISGAMDDTFDVDEILKGAEKDVLGGEELDEDAILGMEESFEKTTANHKEVG